MEPECLTCGMAAKKKVDEPEVATIRLVYAIAGVGEAGTVFRDVELTHQLATLIDKGLAEYIVIDGYGQTSVVDNPADLIEVDEPVA